MPRSTTLFLAISLLVLNSCAGKLYKDAQTTAIAPVIIDNLYFSDPATDYVYRSHISVYGNDLNGILILKKLPDSGHRIVFTTDFGNKLLDCELSQSGFKVNAVVEELDRKLLLKTLEQDFKLLLTPFFKSESMFKLGNDEIYISEKDGTFYYLWVDKQGSLRKIVQGSSRKEKLSVLFTSENNTFAPKIELNHFDIKLKMELTSLEKK